MKLINDSTQSQSNGTQADRVAYGLSMFESLGMNRDQALGGLGSLAGESGREFNTRAHNAADPGARGSVGIAQWNRERLDALDAFAANNNRDVNDYRTQFDFVKHELQGTHAHALRSMLAAPTTADAARVWTRQYEVAAPATAHVDRRIANAEYFRQIAAGGLPDVSAYAETAQTAQSPFDALLGDVGKVANGVMHIASGDFLSQIFSPQATAKADPNQVGGVNPFAADQTSGQSDASGKVANQNGFWDKPSIGSMLGTVVGGAFGGPIGAFLGGFAGQAITSAQKNAASNNEKSIINKSDAGLIGGVGRALDDSLHGVFSSLFGQGDKAKTQTEQLARDYYPPAPKPSNDSVRGSGEITPEGRHIMETSQQARDAINSGRPGLY